MREQSDYKRNFASFHVQEAIYRTEHKQEEILVETRMTALEDQLFFTIVNNQQIRASSIHKLVHLLPSLLSLDIKHSIRLLWNDEKRRAEIEEIFRPRQTSQNSLLASSQLRLTVDNKTYETTICDTLMDAIWDLQEIIQSKAEIWLYTCFHCQYNGHAMNYLVGDREYWCYRAVPEAFAEIRAKRKAASQSARFAGKYFVNAFHTCAAWQLSQPPYVVSPEED